MKTNKFSNKTSKVFALILGGYLSIISPVIALAQVAQPVSAPITIPVIIPNPTPTPQPTATPLPSVSPTPSATPTPTPIPVAKYNVNGQIITTFKGIKVPLINNEVVAQNIQTGKVYKTKTAFNGSYSFKLTNGNYKVKPTKSSNTIQFTPEYKVVNLNGSNINNVSFSYKLTFWR